MMRIFASQWHPCYLYGADRIGEHSNRLCLELPHQRK